MTLSWIRMSAKVPQLSVKEVVLLNRHYRTQYIEPGRSIVCFFRKRDG